MPIVTERLYRNHLIQICPAIYPNGATGEARGTEAGMFHHAEEEIDAFMGDDRDAEDPDGDYARNWRRRNGWAK